MKRAYLACFALHFFLICAASFRSTLGALSTGKSFFSDAAKHWLEQGGVFAATALGRDWSPRNPARQTLDLYTHATGIETGYGFFAPNVPDNYKLVFQLYYEDGRVELALPSVGNAATGIRLVDLLDRIEQIEYPALRELVMRMLAYSIWSEHPDAIQVRAIFGLVHLPTINAFKAGEKETYETLFVYDFNLPAASQP